MKLPWDRNYFKISFYIIFTAVTIYFLIRILDGFFYTVTAPGTALSGTASFFGGLFSLLLPLILGLAIAYILDPVTDFYQRRWDRLFKVKKKNAYPRRTAGVVLTFATVAGAAAGLVFFCISKMDDTGDIARNMTNMVNTIIDTSLEKINRWELADYVAVPLNNLIGEVHLRIIGLTDNIVKKASAAGSFLINLFIAIVVAFYFLQRKAHAFHILQDIFKTFTPLKWQKPIIGFLADLHTVFSGYIRGQILDAAILSVLISLGLTFVGIDFAVTIGIITGFGNLIPFVGAAIGFILSVSVALLSGSWLKAVYAGAVILVLQQIDGMVIVPKVVGERVKLSPPAVILVLAAAGRLFGLVGMVFAVPVCGVVKIILTRFIARYKIKRKK